MRPRPGRRGAATAERQVLALDLVAGRIEPFVGEINRQPSLHVRIAPVHPADADSEGRLLGKHPAVAPVGAAEIDLHVLGAVRQVRARDLHLQAEADHRRIERRAIEPPGDRAVDPVGAHQVPVGPGAAAGLQRRTTRAASSMSGRPRRRAASCSAGLPRQVQPSAWASKARRMVRPIRPSIRDSGAPAMKKAICSPPSTISPGRGWPNTLSKEARQRSVRPPPQSFSRGKTALSIRLDGKAPPWRR